MSISSKKIFLKDRNGNYLLPISDSSLIQYTSSGGEETVKKSLDNINSYIGGLAGITDKINSKINTLDSDTNIGETVSNGGKINTDGEEQFVHNKNWLTYVGIVDGKIQYAEFTKATADNVDFSYQYTPAGTTDTPNPEPINTTVSVSQRLSYLSDYADSLNQKIVDNTSKTDRLAGLNNLHAGDGIDFNTQTDDDGKLTSVTVKAKVDNVTTYIGTDNTIKVRGINAREVSVDAINNLSDETQTLPEFLSTTYTKLYDSINESKSLSYSKSDKEYNDIISRLGLVEGATEASKDTSFFTRTNSVKKVTDELSKSVTDNKIDVYKDSQNNNISGLTISDPQIADGKSGRTIKINVDNDSIFLNSTNALSTNQYSLEYETTDKTGDKNSTHLIKLYSNNPGSTKKTLVSQIDATDFVKDSFLKDVSLTNANSGDDATNAILRMVWNTALNDSYNDNEQYNTRTVDVDLRNFIKPYKASNEGLSLNNQTFQLNISNGLTIGTKYNSENDTTKRLYLNIDETSTDFNNSGKNNSSFVTLSENGLKISGIQKAINDAISKVNFTETPLVKDNNNKISTPTKVITGLTTTVSDNNIVTFTPSSVDLIANNIQYQYTTTGDDGKTITTINESIGSYLNYLGETVDDIKHRFGDTVIANLKSRISSWDENQTYTGKIVSTIEENAGLVKATQYSFVDEFKLQTSLTPDNKAKSGTDGHDDLHESLSNALSYLTSKNTKQDAHLSDLDTQLQTTSDNVKYTAVKIPANKSGNNVFNTSSYLTVTPATSGKTTTYTLELKDVASAATLNSVNTELTSGNKLPVTSDNQYTSTDKRTDGALFFEQIGTSTVDINPSLFL